MVSLSIFFCNAYTSKITSRNCLLTTIYFYFISFLAVLLEDYHFLIKSVPGTYYWALVYYLNNSYLSQGFLYTSVLCVILVTTFFLRLKSNTLSIFFFLGVCTFFCLSSIENGCLYSSYVNEPSLNSNLTNGLLISHPITLYFGYSILIVLSVISHITVCVSGTSYSTFLYNFCEQKKSLKLASLILCFACFMGSFWAQQELNWGGWWSWDIIELVAALSYVYSIACIHVYVHSKRYCAILVRAYIYVYILSFTLSRFNIVASIHSFVSSSSVYDNRDFILVSILLSIVYIFLFTSNKDTNTLLYKKFTDVFKYSAYTHTSLWVGTFVVYMFYFLQLPVVSIIKSSSFEENLKSQVYVYVVYYIAILFVSNSYASSFIWLMLSIQLKLYLNVAVSYTMVGLFMTLYLSKSLYFNSSGVIHRGIRLKSSVYVGHIAFISVVVFSYAFAGIEIIVKAFFYKSLSCHREFYLHFTQSHRYASDSTRCFFPQNFNNHIFFKKDVNFFKKYAKYTKVLYQSLSSFIPLNVNVVDFNKSYIQYQVFLFYLFFLFLLSNIFSFLAQPKTIKI